MLQVRENDIIDDRGKSVRLKGVCVGGWMNMENFINGYPGDEHGLRAVAAEVLGPGKAAFLFDRWLDHFLAEEDIAFISSCGANVVRLPLNYRHFESDGEPFRYREEGFARLERAVGWCAKHGLFAILDLHAVQGWQNTDWHSDNSSRQTLFWRHPHFQDRFVALWEELARRYKGNETIAGYNVMNEPVTNAPAGRFNADREYTTDGETFNRVYRRVVEKIRAVDPDHIVFLEGDLFSSRFEKLDAPFAENLAYSSHNYTSPTYDPSRKEIARERRDENLRRQRELFLAHEGTQYARKYNVPLWVGEFGANGGSSLEDQVRVFEENKAHWTFWTYKGTGVMSFMNISSDSEYQRLLAPVLKAKRDLGVDNWLADGVPGSTVGGAIGELAGLIEAALPDAGIDPAANRRYLAQAALGGYAATLMQPAWAERFKGLSEEKLDDVLQSFALKNCRPWESVFNVLKKYWTRSEE